MRFLSVCVFLLTMTSCQYITESTSSDLATVDTATLAAEIANKSVHVFDNNSKAVYLENHLPGATYMDPRQPDIQLLPADKKSSLVFYCKNEWCMASHRGARFAIENGYKNARVYSAGIDGWLEAGMKASKGP